MARDDKSLDELDEEMEKLEAELRALEEGEDPEDLELEDEPAEEGEEGDQPPDDDPDEAPEDEGSGGLMDKLPFGGSKEDEEEPVDAEEDTPPEAEEEAGEAEVEETDPPDEAEGDEEEDDGGKGLFGRFKRDKDQAEETEADEEPGEAEETDPPEEDEDSGGKGLFARFKRDKDQAEEAAPPEELAAEAPAPAPAEEEELDEEELERRETSDLWERTPEGRWRRKHPDEVQAEETEPAEEEEGQGRARDLLARFGTSGQEEEEPPVETSDGTALVPVEEEDDGRAIPIWILWILLGIVIVALIAAAAVLLGDDGGPGGAAGPTAAATVSGGSPAPGGGFVAVVGQAVTFDASDTTGTVDTYEWDFGDGETASTGSATTTHTYASRGDYNVTLTAIGDGGESTANVQVLVVQAPQAVPQVLVGGQPAARPGQSGNHPLVGETVTLDGSGSSADAESSLASYAWDLDGDGTADANGETAEASFDAVGAWNVSLTVTDDLGNTNTSVVPVGVGRVDVFNDTVGQAVGSASANEHPLPVEAGRQGGQPFELRAVLNYTPPQAGVNENLDLFLVPPEGDPFQAEDDGGSGQETITLSGADLETLGQWTVRVEHRSPSTNSVEYSVTVELLY